MCSCVSHSRNLERVKSIAPITPSHRARSQAVRYGSFFPISPISQVPRRNGADTSAGTPNQRVEPQRARVGGGQAAGRKERTSKREEKRRREASHSNFFDSTHVRGDYHTTMNCFSTPFGTARLSAPRIEQQSSNPSQMSQPLFMESLTCSRITKAKR